MAWLDNLRTAVYFLTFGVASVCIITMDIALRKNNTQPMAINTDHMATSRREMDESEEFSNEPFPACSIQDRRKWYMGACASTKAERNFPDELKSFDDVYFNDELQIIACGGLDILMAIFTTHREDNCTALDGLVAPLDEFTPLASVSAGEMRTKLESYKKILFLQSPHAHLASQLSRLLRRANQSKPSDEMTSSANSFEYREVSSYMKNGGNFSEIGKISSFYDLCHPCEITYDIIFKLETMDRDLAVLFENFIDKSPPNPEKLCIYDSLMKINNFNWFPSMFPELDKTMQKYLRSVLKQDQEMFGYRFSNNSAISCAFAKSSTSCC